MADATITCPNCHQEIRLTDALAAPFIEKAREELAADFRKRTDELAAKEAQLEKDRSDVDRRVAAALEAERERLTTRLAEDARKAVEREMDELRVKYDAGAKKAEADRAERIELLKKLGDAEAAKAADLVTKFEETDEWWRKYPGC